MNGIDPNIVGWTPVALCAEEDSDLGKRVGSQIAVAMCQSDQDLPRLLIDQCVLSNRSFQPTTWLSSTPPTPCGSAQRDN
jgi:hypothetical protein